MKSHKQCLAVIAIIAVSSASLFSQTVYDAKENGLSYAGRVVSLVDGDSVISSVRYYPELDSMYIIQFTLPPFNTQSAVKKLDKTNLSTVQDQNLKNAQSDLSLLKVEHKKFMSDLAQIEKKLGLTDDKDSLVSEIIAHYYIALNGVAIKTSPAVIAEIKKLKTYKSIDHDIVVEAIDEQSNEIMQAPQVWNKLGSRGENIVIGILDTGIDPDHPDLQGKVTGGYDFVNGDNNAMDDHGHGTHCAGIAAANGPTLQGVAPDADLMAIKVLDGSGEGYGAWVIQGIEYALDPDGDPLTDDKVDVLSVSLGASGNPNDVLSKAIDNAVSNGLVCVIAAGNKGPAYSSIASPGCAKKALTIGASDKNDRMADFSSRGPAYSTLDIKPDLVAPGVQIYSSLPDNQYASWSGTSMATPHIAGAAALLLAQHPDWTPEKIKSALVNTAVDLGENILTQGAGRADVFAAAQSNTFFTPSIINFGEDDNEQALWSNSQALTITNNSATVQEYRLSAPTLLPAGIRFEYPAALKLSANETIEIVVTVHVDNTLVETPSTPFIYEGKLLLETNTEDYTLPFAFFKGPRLEIEFDTSPTFLEITTLTEKLIHIPNPGTYYAAFMEPGIYNIIAIFDWGKKIVVKEEVEIQHNSIRLTMNERDAIHEVRFAGVDPDGNALALVDFGIERLSYKGIPGGLFNLFDGMSYDDTIYYPVNRYFSDLSANFNYEISPVSFPRMNSSNELYSIPHAIHNGVSESTELVNSPEDFVEVNYKLSVNEDETLFNSWGMLSDNFYLYNLHDIYMPEASTFQKPYDYSRYLIPQPTTDYTLNYYYQDRIYTYHDNTIVYDSTVMIPGIFSLPYQGGKLGITRRTPEEFTENNLPRKENFDIEIPILNNRVDIPMGLTPPHFSGYINVSTHSIKLHSEHPYFSNPYYDISCGDIRYKLTRNNHLLNTGIVRNTFEWNTDEKNIALEADTYYSLELLFDSYFIKNSKGAATLKFNFFTQSNKQILINSFKNFLIYSDDSLNNELLNTAENRIVFSFVGDDMTGTRLFLKKLKSDTWIPLQYSRNGDNYEAMIPQSLTSGYYSIRLEAENSFMDTLFYTLEPAFHFTSNTKNQVDNITSEYVFTSIQDAINVASEGDTLIVHPGTYKENINFLGKNLVVSSLYLFSQDTSDIAQTIIAGDSTHILVTFSQSENSSAKLKGFTLMHGLGAILCEFTSPTLEDLKIIDNFSGDYPRAAGAYFSRSNSVLRNILVAYNETHPDFDFGWSNGIYLRDSKLDIHDIEFYRNSVNSAPDRAGSSGFIILQDRGTHITGLLIDECYQRVLHIVSTAPVKIENVLITENYTNRNSGGIISIGAGSTVDFTHATITNNLEYSDQGLIQVENDCHIGITNSIIRNNLNNQIFFDATNPNPNSLWVSYSNIEGGKSSIITNGICDLQWLEGNIDKDPLFVDISKGNYQLQPESPCLGAGNPTSPLLSDISGNKRPSPENTNPDMGAYEEQLTIPGSKTASSQLPAKVSVYPNPVSAGTGIFTVSTSGEEILAISLYDFTGNKIQELLNVNASTIEFRLDAICEGMHFLQIHLEDVTLVEKILINQ